MKLTENTFKKRIKNNETLVGIWLALANSYSTEILAYSGFDWCLIDNEHAPNSLTSILEQLQVLEGKAIESVVRVAWNDAVEIKKVLDIGARTLLIPMVQNADEAQKAVAAMLYPPEGTRGVGSALARASCWNQIDDYLERANQEVCTLIQVETSQAIKNLAEICQVKGIDGIFIGPADLAADMGYLGNPKHPEVLKVIKSAISYIKSQNIATGILMSDETLAFELITEGVNFIAVGTDISILNNGAQQLAKKFKAKNCNEAINITHQSIY